MVSVVFDGLLDSDKLPSPPIIASKILALAEDPKSSLRDFSNLISCDVGLVVQLIKVSNSAFYSVRNPVLDLDRAINTIGLSALVPLVVSFSMKGLVDTIGSPLNFEPFWKRSVLLSSVSVFLSLHAKNVSKEEALLAGLLQDFGVLAAGAIHPEKYTDLQEYFLEGHGCLVSMEKARFGFDHSVIGATLLRSWDFPPSVGNAVLYSHSLPDEKIRDLRWCVSGANMIVSQITPSLEEGDLWGDICKSLSLPWLNLSISEIEPSITEILHIVADTANLFDVAVLPADVLKTIGTRDVTVTP